MEPTESADPVIEVLELCLDARERGGDAAVEEVLSSHPEHAGAVRTRLDALLRSGLLQDGAQGVVPERLGEFRLLSRIGSGGMGVVYLAEQESLGRRVALKLVHPEHLPFPGARERFRREVEATARLDHSGIAPVYVVGEQHGVPYFAMEYVVGRSIEQVLSTLRTRRPEHLVSADLCKAAADGAVATTPSPDTPLPRSWIDGCMAVAAQIAAALTHAHERGVLHRDIKPSNVMITPTGRARLLDFGLVRSEGDVRITRSGSVLGSLPYMAPEQVRGETRDIAEHTDIYGVGVTLYEMLTLRPAYWSETAERTRQRVLDGRPVAIERLNSSVPWDAETICLTAMDLDPARRYASMAALSEDLGRFLRREPILAKRPGPWLRTRRWMQRNPAVATGIVFSAVLAVGLPLGYALQSESARARISKAFDAEAKQRARAEDGREVAIASVDEMLEHATDPVLARTPGGELVRRRMLESTRDMYERLLSREAGAADLTQKVVRAHLRLAQIHEELGDRASALASARAASELARQLDPSAAGIGDLRAAVELMLIAFQNQNNEVEEAARRATELIAALESESEPEPDAVTDESWQRLCRLANAWYRLGDARFSARDIEGAIEAGQRSIENYERAVELKPERRVPKLELATSLEFVAYIAGFHGQSADYSAMFERAIELRDQGRDEGVEDPKAAYALGKALGSWAHVEIIRNEAPAAVVRARRSVEVLDRLSDSFPLRPSYAAAAAEMAFRLAAALSMTGDDDGSLAVLRAATERAEAALERSPEEFDLVMQLAMLSSTLAALLGEAGAPEEADPLFRRSAELWSSLIDRPDPRLSALLQVGVLYDAWARFEQGQDRLEHALELAQKACAYHRRAHDQADLDMLIGRLGQSLTLVAAIETARGRLSEAVAALDRAVREARVRHDELVSEEFEPLTSRDDFRALLDRASEAGAGHGR